MRDFLAEMFLNPVFVSALAAWYIAQFSKAIIYAIITKKFAFERMFGSGGMPSSHSATVCALATATGFYYGAGGFEFALAFVLATIVMHDAMGVRREAGNQARIINEMIELLDIFGDKSPISEKLKEFVGHTPLQVLVGALSGIATAVIVCNLM